MRFRYLALTILAVVSLPASSRAQEVALVGTITDTTNAVLPGATITAQHVASGNRFIGTSDASGPYRIGALRPGVYTITAELSGFSTVLRENLELLAGQRAVLMRGAESADLLHEPVRRIQPPRYHGHSHGAQGGRPVRQ